MDGQRPKKTKEAFDQLAKETRVFATVYLQMAEGLSEINSKKKLAYLSTEKKLLYAQKGKELIVKILDPISNFVYNPKLMKYFKNNRPEEYEELMSSIRKTDPETYEYLIKIHNQ